MNDWKLTSFNADVSAVARATAYAAELTAENLLSRTDSEQMGHTALEVIWDKHGIAFAGGVGGAGQGRNSLDALGYKPGELHIGHCHGGTSRALTFTEEGRTIPAGFGPSIGCRLLADREFVDKMRQMPALWNAIASGQVSLFWDMVFAPSGRLDDIRFTSTPITLPPSEMAALNQAITSA